MTETELGCLVGGLSLAQWSDAPIVDTLPTIDVDCHAVKLGLFRRRRDLTMVAISVPYLDEFQGQAETMALRSFNRSTDSFVAARLRTFSPRAWGRLSVVWTEPKQQDRVDFERDYSEMRLERSLAVVRSQMWAAPWEKERKTQNARKRAVQRAMLEAGEYPTLQRASAEINDAFREAKRQILSDFDQFLDRFRSPQTGEET